MTVFKAACVQMNSGSDMAANIATADRLIRQAAAQGAAFITLPENVSLMKEHGTSFDGHIYSEAEHPALIGFAKVAKECNAHVLVGSLAVAKGDKLANRSYLINAQGQITARYDKIHLFDATLSTGESYMESRRFAPGDEAVVAQLPWAKLGMTICYDLRFPVLHRMLAKAGAQILTIPAAFTRPTGEAHWHVLLRARAIETGCYVIAPAQYGVHPGERKTYGHSLIIDPWGKIIAEAPAEEEAVIVAEMDVAKVSEARTRVPALVHERVFEVRIQGTGFGIQEE